MLRARHIARLGPLAVALAFGAHARADVGYACTINQTASTLAYSFSASAPFGASGTPTVNSTLVGENDTTRPAAEQTRTKRLATPFSPCGTLTATQNDTVNISGTIAASGSSPTPSTTHPGGTFKLAVNTGALTCRLQDFNANLVASGAISAAANLNSFTYQSFCAINPSCTAPFLIPISLPLGTIDVSSLLAQQAPGVPDSGTLTASGANSWNFSVTTTMTVTPTITFSGAPLAADPQQVPATFSGTITLSGNTATITGTTTLNYSPPAAAPGLQPPTAFGVPTTSTLCAGINIILTLNIISSTVTSNNTANLSAAGTRFACKCDTNANGALEIQDIFDFLNLWFAGSPQADFNGGGLSVQDIFDFLACWFNRPIGC